MPKKSKYNPSGKPIMTSRPKKSQFLKAISKDIKKNKKGRTKR